MRKLIASLIVAAGLTAGAAVTIAAEEGAQAQQPAVPNFFDPSAWMGAYGTAPQGGQTGQAMPFNPANPAGWAMFIDPKTHEQAHMAFMNPAQYAAFMNPATYMYWMNPATYTHMMNPAMYMQFMNPAAYNAYMNPNTYMQWMNPGAYAMPATASAGAVPFNFFDPNAWAQMVPQQPAEQAKQ